MGLVVLYWSAGGVLATTAGMGTKTLLVREIAAEPRRGPALLSAAFYLRAISVAPALLATLVYLRIGSFSGPEAVVLELAFLASVVVLFSEPLQAAFQAMERMEYLAAGDIVVKAASTAAAVILVLLGYGAVPVVLLMLLPRAMMLVAYFVAVRHHIQIDLRFDPRAVTRLFRESMTFWAYAVSISFYFWIDSILLAVLAPPEQLGWYGAPVKLVSTLAFVPTIIWAVWLPRLSSAYRISPGSLKSAARMPIDIIVVLGLPVACGAALIAGPLIKFLYGDGFAPSLPVFVVLVITILPVYLNTAFGNILIASNRQRIWTVVMAVACVVNPVLNLILIPAFQARANAGALGAAWALVVTELLITASGLFIVRGILSRGTFVRLGKAALATAVMAVLVVASSRLGLIVEMAVGALTFAVAALVLRIATPDELEEIGHYRDRAIRSLQERIGRSRPLEPTEADRD
jgi:O-antigen/teichoic acid export membrane protein